MIVIINGSPGVGKSTIANKLCKKLKKAVVIEIDKVKYFAVDAGKRTEDLDIADKQIFTMVKGLRKSKESIVLDYVYDSTKYFQSVVKILRGIDRNVFAYRLRSTLSENLHRDLRRPANIRMKERVNHLADRLDELGDAVGYTVETTGLSVEKTAEKIFLLINAGIGRS